MKKLSKVTFKDVLPYQARATRDRISVVDAKDAIWFHFVDGDTVLGICSLLPLPRGSGKTEAASTLLQIASTAILSPQETAPLDHYRDTVSEAIRTAYGYDFELSELSNRDQIKAIDAWGWFYDLFPDSWCPQHLTVAISLLRSGQRQDLCRHLADHAVAARRDNDWDDEYDGALSLLCA